jgi:hypothetical protein
MIEMLGELIRAILGMIVRGDVKLAEEKLNEAYLTFLRKDASFFHLIPLEKLTFTLLTEHNYTNGHLEILAELFNAEGALQDARGNLSDSLVMYEKSLSLFSFAEENVRTYSEDRIEKMGKIRKRMTEITQNKIALDEKNRPADFRHDPDE